jgi:hypothetical protein
LPELSQPRLRCAATPLDPVDLLKSEYRDRNVAQLPLIARLVRERAIETSSPSRKPDLTPTAAFISTALTAQPSAVQNSSLLRKKVLAKMITFCSMSSWGMRTRRFLMRPWTITIAAAALIAAAWWHLPAAAQRAPQPAASEAITFEEYRDFRLRDLAQRQARLAQQLAAPGLSAAERTSLERRKSHYDQLAAMPEEERDRLYRERFDEIDANHDGKLDPQERAAWREKQRENYRQQAAARAHPPGERH